MKSPGFVDVRYHAQSPTFFVLPLYSASNLKISQGTIFGLIEVVEGVGVVVVAVEV